MQTAILNINGMTCMGCVTSIEKVLEKIAGVSDSDISLKKNRLRFSMTQKRPI